MTGSIITGNTAMADEIVEVPVMGAGTSCHDGMEKMRLHITRHGQVMNAYANEHVRTLGREIPSGSSPVEQQGTEFPWAWCQDWPGPIRDRKAGYYCRWDN